MLQNVARLTLNRDQSASRWGLPMQPAVVKAAIHIIPFTDKQLQATNSIMLCKILTFTSLTISASAALRGGKSALYAQPARDRLQVNTEWGPLKEVILGRSRFEMGNVMLAATLDDPLGWSAEAISIFPKDEWMQTLACTKPGNQANWHGQRTNTTAVPCDTKSQMYCDRSENKNAIFCRSCYNPCATFEETERETNAVLDILTNFTHADGSNITVWRPDAVDPTKLDGNYGEKGHALQGGQDLFSRDIVQVIGNLLIMLEPGSPSRRGEQLLYNNVLGSQIKGSNAARISMPNRDWSKQFTPAYDKNEYPVLEGGDFMLMGDTILIGHSANKVMGSSKLGCEWFRDTIHSLGFTQKVVCVPLPKNILHLDIVMSVPRHGLAIVAPAAFIDFAVLENGVLQGWDLIKVDELAATKMAVNGLPLDENNIIVAHNEPYVDPCCETFSCGNSPMDIVGACGPKEIRTCVDKTLAPYKFSSKCAVPGQPVQMDGKFSYVQEELEKRGITVHPVMYARHAAYGGAIRCSTHPFKRDVGSSGI